MYFHIYVHVILYQKYFSCHLKLKVIKLCYMRNVFICLIVYSSFINLVKKNLKCFVNNIFIVCKKIIVWNLFMITKCKIF